MTKSADIANKHSEIHHLQSGPRNGTVFFYASTSSKINQFSHFFHCQNQDKICKTPSLKIALHFRCVATLPCIL